MEGPGAFISTLIVLRKVSYDSLLTFVAINLNSTLSTKRNLEEGLPQGSALSCTLFLIYINDLADNIEVHTALFADDLVMWTSGKHFLQMQRMLNRAL